MGVWAWLGTGRAGARAQPGAGRPGQFGQGVRARTSFGQGAGAARLSADAVEQQSGVARAACWRGMGGVQARQSGVRTRQGDARARHGQPADATWWHVGAARAARGRDRDSARAQ